MPDVPDHSLPADPIRTRRNRDFGDEPLAYYRDHYSGVTRGELQKRDRSLYQTLWRKELLEHVPVKVSPYGNDPLAYYRNHYHGLTRGEVYERDPNLYMKLWREGLLRKVPNKRLY